MIRVGRSRRIETFGKSRGCRSEIFEWSALGDGVDQLGEATTRDYTGTVHGAYATGVEAANECFSCLRDRGVLAPSLGKSMLEVAPVSSALPLIVSRM